MPKRPVRCMRWFRPLWTFPPASGHGEDDAEAGNRWARAQRLATGGLALRFYEAVRSLTGTFERAPSVPEGAGAPTPPAQKASGMVEAAAAVQNCGRTVAPPPLQSKVAVVTVTFGEHLSHALQSQDAGTGRSNMQPLRDAIAADLDVPDASIGIVSARQPPAGVVDILLVQNPCSTRQAGGQGGRKMGDFDGHSLAEELVEKLSDSSSSLRATELCANVSNVQFSPLFDIRDLREDTIACLRSMLQPSNWASLSNKIEDAIDASEQAQGECLVASEVQTDSTWRPNRSIGVGPIRYPASGDDSFESGAVLSMQPGQDVAKKLERIREVESAKRGPSQVLTPKGTSHAESIALEATQSATGASPTLQSFHSPNGVLGSMSSARSVVNCIRGGEIGTRQFAMTPRTEVRRHMQGRSAAAVRKERAASPACGQYIWGHPYEQLSLSNHVHGDHGGTRADQRATPSPVTDASVATTMEPIKGNSASAQAVVGRGTWVASSAGGPRAAYQAKKSDFLWGVENGVTAMRGAAGWRRQLELAATRASAQDSPPDSHAWRTGEGGGASVGSWMHPTVVTESVSSWMTPSQDL